VSASESPSRAAISCSLTTPAAATRLRLADGNAKPRSLDEVWNESSPNRIVPDEGPRGDVFADRFGDGGISWTETGPSGPVGVSSSSLKAPESCAGLAASLLLLAACPARHRTMSAPESTAASAMPTTTASATLLPPTVDAAPAASDARPLALRRLVPSDDPDAGHAAPTGVVPDCEDKLQSAGVTFRPSALPVHVQGPATCGAPQVVVYLRGPGDITYDPAPLLTCAMALAMASFEHILQEEANRTLQSRVVRVQQIGTYSCREIAAVKGLASEHSYANAIDLTRFTLANGKIVTVLSDFDLVDRPTHPAGVFLRAISVRAHSEDVFSNVLTPFWDPAHKNHFHLDLARYRVNGVERRVP